MICNNLLTILKCPNTGQDILQIDDHTLCSSDKSYSYKIHNGIIYFTSNDNEDEKEINRTEKKIVKQFYDNYGWKRDESGTLNDSILFTNTKGTVGDRYIQQSMMRVGKYISPGGTYLLDAGSGAIPHDEMLAYHQNYEKRICVDMSETALDEAKRKLGDRGVFILGDITKLPFKDGTIDSFVCCHAIYHVPKDEQEKVFSELGRILKSGSKGAVVYSWDKSVLEKLFRMLSKFVCLVAKAPEVVAINRGNAPGLYSWFHTRQWFTEKKWLFDYEIYSYRLLSGDFIQKVLDSSLRSRLITSLATMLESKFPKFTGKYGKYPIIQIMRK